MQTSNPALSLPVIAELSDDTIKVHILAQNGRFTWAIFDDGEEIASMRVENISLSKALMLTVVQFASEWEGMGDSMVRTLEKQFAKNNPLL